MIKAIGYFENSEVSSENVLLFINIWFSVSAT